MVSLLVLLQVAGIREPVRAECTAIRSLSGVDVPVDLQVPELGELLSTDRAAERLLAGVRPQVRLQVCWGRETFPTEVTGIGPLLDLFWLWVQNLVVTL